MDREQMTEIGGRRTEVFDKMTEEKKLKVTNSC